jgi:catechol 2,3-dioxygenase-like lactoylglutathione lyase family enzyme
MATRKSRSTTRRAGPPRTVRPVRKKTTMRKTAAPPPERRREERATLRLRSIAPTLTVNDLTKSVRFYADVLGFIVIEQISDGAVLQGALLQAGVCRLGLSQDDWAKGRDRRKGEGIRIWCNTGQDIDAVARRITAAGGRLAEAPGNQPWGARSVSVTDPDGFRLTIYSEK